MSRSSAIIIASIITAMGSIAVAVVNKLSFDEIMQWSNRYRFTQLSSDKQLLYIQIEKEVLNYLEENHQFNLVARINGVAGLHRNQLVIKIAQQIAENGQNVNDAEIDSQTDKSSQKTFKLLLNSYDLLRQEIENLEETFKRPYIVKKGDTHWHVAYEYLTREINLSNRDAAVLLARTLLVDELEPGFFIYNFYHKGDFLTTVTQGDADKFPVEKQKSVNTSENGRSF